MGNLLGGRRGPRLLALAPGPRALLDDDSPDLTALGDAAGQVARAAPELGAEPHSEPEPERSRFALFDGIAALLTAAARRRPLVVVLDDLHDADEPSVALLGFLGRALAAIPVVVIGTSRDVDTALPGGLGTRLGQEVHTLPLRGLGLDDVADLVALHAPGAPAVVRHGSAGAHRRQPVFHRGAARPRRRGPGPGFGRRAAGPARRSRRDSCPPGAVAARLGRAARHGFGHRHRVRARRARSRGRNRRSRGDRPTRAAARARARCGRAGRGQRFAFTHALVRDSVYQALPVQRRMELHRSVGEALLEPAGTSRSAAARRARPPLRTRHATPPAGPARDYAQQAAEGAMAVSAWEDAERHFAGALELHCQLPMDEERRCELLLGLGCAQARAGHPENARVTSIEAALVARPLGAARRFALAAIEIGAVGLPPDDEDTAAVDLLGEALRMLDERPSALRARVLARLSVQLYWQGDRKRISELVDEAARIAATLDDPAAKLEVLAQVHLATSRPETPERLRTLGRLLDLAARGQDPEAELQVRIWRGGRAHPTRRPSCRGR